MEQANIDYHQLAGREAKKMRGRSKIVFKNRTKDSLQGVEAEDDREERRQWFLLRAGKHPGSTAAE